MQWYNPIPRIVAVLIALHSISNLAEPIEFIKRVVTDVPFGGDYHLQVFDVEGDGFAQVIVGGDDGFYRYEIHEESNFGAAITPLGDRSSATGLSAPLIDAYGFVNLLCASEEYLVGYTYLGDLLATGVPEFTATTATSITAVYVNGEMVVVTSSMEKVSVFTYSGFVFTQRLNFSLASRHSSVGINDWDNDGMHDILVATIDGLRVVFGSGHLEYSFSDAKTINLDVSSIQEVAFINVDALQDILVTKTSWSTSGDVSEVHWLENVPASTQEDGKFISVGDMARVGYFNNDSHPDVVIGDTTSGSVTLKWYENDIDGTGDFVVAHDVDTDLLALGAIGVGDVNGDNRSDIVAIVRSSEDPDQWRLVWYQNDVNECETDVCPFACINTPGGYICTTPTPTSMPTPMPTLKVTDVPSTPPTPNPTNVPTDPPTAQPSPLPSLPPTLAPSPLPSNEPTLAPSPLPSNEPTLAPSYLPTARPTRLPTQAPTRLPTSVPTPLPSTMPTRQPTREPTDVPSAISTIVPTARPTYLPIETPPATGNVTAVATPMPTMSECGQINHDTRALGNEFRSFINIGDSYGDCCDKCTSDDACLWFSFNKRDNNDITQCLLYDNIDAVHESKVGLSPDWISAASADFAEKAMHMNNDAYLSWIFENTALFIAITGVAGCSVALYFLSRKVEGIRKDEIQNQLEDLEKARIEAKIISNHSRGDRSLNPHEIEFLVNKQMRNRWTLLRIGRTLAQFGTGKHGVVFTVALALIDVIADCFFLVDLRSQEGGFLDEDGNLNLLPFTALSFLVATLAVNFFVIVIVLRNEFQRVETWRWYVDNSAIATLTFVLSLGNVETMSVLASRIFGSLQRGKRFNAPFTDECLKSFYWLGIVGNFLEDLPQIAFQLYVFVARPSQTSALTGVALATSITALLFGIGRRVLLYMAFRQDSIGREEHFTSQARTRVGGELELVRRAGALFPASREAMPDDPHRMVRNRTYRDIANDTFMSTTAVLRDGFTAFIHASALGMAPVGAVVGASGAESPVNIEQTWRSVARQVEHEEQAAEAPIAEEETSTFRVSYE